MKVYKSKISVKQTASHGAHATVTATVFPTATASSPSVATTAAGAVFFTVPSTSSGNSFSSNSSRRKSNSK